MLLFPIKAEQNATFFEGVEMAANEKGSLGSGDIEWQRIITVLTLLARKVKKVNIAEQVDRSEKWVRDVEKEALNYRVSLIITLPLEVQDFIVINAKARPGLKSEIEKFKSSQRENQATLPENVTPLNNINRLIVNDKNHIEEQTSKAKVNTQFLEDHYKVLSTTAFSIAELVHYVGKDTGEQTISQIVDKLGTWQGGGDPPVGQFEQCEELSDLLSSTEAKWLLSHIKSEAPDLFIHIMYAHPEYFTSIPYKKPESEHIDRWEDMTQDDVYAYGENLIDLLKLRAGRLDFKGTCDFCEGRK